MLQEEDQVDPRMLNFLGDLNDEFGRIHSPFKPKVELNQKLQKN